MKPGTQLRLTEGNGASFLALVTAIVSLDDSQSGIAVEIYPDTVPTLLFHGAGNEWVDPESKTLYFVTEWKDEEMFEIAQGR